MADEVQEIGGILPVMNGEGWVETDRMGEVAQEPRTNGVKGAGPADGGQPLAHAAAGEDTLDPPLHFLRGAPGKGEQQDAARIGALLDEIGDPMGKRLGLAGTSPRNDQQWPTARAIVRGAGLICVEG
jgi:hypothetical protein